MRIFVTGTGRCGTVTFSKAAAHATNYTVGHESHAGKPDNWIYPDNHIEVSASLTVAIFLLQRRYPQALWIHIQRMDRQACVKSLATTEKAMDAFSFFYFQQPSPDREVVAGNVYDAITALCNLHCERRLTLEVAKSEWAGIWEFMRCKGNFEASLKEWDTKYNARKV